jgi:hypothetical protein
VSTWVATQLCVVYGKSTYYFFFEKLGHPGLCIKVMHMALLLFIYFELALILITFYGSHNVDTYMNHRKRMKSYYNDTY